MPVLNRLGQAAMGVGDGPGSVDGRVVAAPGGGICWLDDERVLLQTQIGGLDVLIVVPVNGGRVETIEPARGANALAAGGGRWFAWLAGTGLYGSLGTMPTAGLVAAGPDGTLAYCPDYQTGVGLVLVAPDGSTVTAPTAMVVDRNCQVFGPGAALWLDYDYPGGLRVIGRPLVRTALRPGRTRLATLPDGDWLVYWSEGTGLVAQLDGASDGYVLESRPIAFNHDAMAVRGQLVVAWSITQGEGPGDLVTVTVDRTQPRIPLVGPPPQPPTAPDPIDPEEKEPPMRLPDGVQAIVEALYQRFPSLAHGEDEQRRTLTRKIVEQTVFSFPGQGWGWKSADPNRPPSKDAIALQRPGLFVAFDLFNGGTRKPNDRPEAIDITGQHFIPVVGVDHLGRVAPPAQPPAPPAPPAPSVDLAPLVAAITALRDELADLKALAVELAEDVEALESRPTVDQAAVGAAVGAMLAGYEVNGRTGRDRLGLQHDVKLAITRKS